jgi:hypothetical protein
MVSIYTVDESYAIVSNVSKDSDIGGHLSSFFEI